MIVMDFKVDNFFAFKNFHINMSYPKKIVDSFIENEFLIDRNNFRYKKVNIIMGGNATGKTSLGSMLMNVINFIDKKNFEMLVDGVCDDTKQAHFSIDFVARSYKFYRVDATISPKEGERYKTSNVKVVVKVEDIRKNDSYESCSKRITDLVVDHEDNYIAELYKVESLTWMFNLNKPLHKRKMSINEDENYLKVLNYTMRALDPSIEKVEKLNKVENSYVIRMKDRDLILQDGALVKDNVLSSGTQKGIEIAGLLHEIKRGHRIFYYCDEKFAYVHSDLEIAFLTVMINSLKDNNQLFFTTHNTEVLDLPLPKHSYVFLKKDVNDTEQPIKCVSAADFLKRNTDSLHNAVDNDLFSVAPSTELAHEILEI